MIGHMGYGKVGYGMMGGTAIFGFFFFLLLLALIWLIVSKALLNTRKYKMMKDFKQVYGKHRHHDCDCDCDCNKEEDKPRRGRKSKD